MHAQILGFAVNVQIKSTGVFSLSHKEDKPEPAWAVFRKLWKKSCFQLKPEFLGFFFFFILISFLTGECGFMLFPFR